MKSFLPIFSIVFAATCLTLAAPVKIQLPNETAGYKPAPGADLANAQCLTCHSAEYVSTQPPLPRAFWKGSVEKMIGKYGAPVPPDQIEALADYLAQNYGTDGTNTAATAATTSPVGAPAADPTQLMRNNGCFNCHTMEKQFIGPAFSAVAKKYQGKPDAAAKISHQITHGGSGLWGPIPMPPFKQFSASEVKTLTDWILSQK